MFMTDWGNAPARSCCAASHSAAALGSLRKQSRAFADSSIIAAACTVATLVSMGKSDRNDDYWTTGNGRQNLSHFVPYEILTVANQRRPGPNYGADTMREIQRVAGSNYNTSETSGWWNQRTNRDAEREIKQYAEGNDSVCYGHRLDRACIVCNGHTSDEVQLLKCLVGVSTSCKDPTTERRLCPHHIR